MIFVDANILIRYMTEPETPEVARMQATAIALFERVETGAVTVTTSEVVLHETCYVLGSKRHYGYTVSEIVPVLATILSWPGFVFPHDEKVVYLRAFDLWEQHPKLEFSDSVIAARCERGGHVLATFDPHFAAIPSLTLWQPEPDESTPEAADPSPP
jgi:predicted nucleic acid-binding protein